MPDFWLTYLPTFWFYVRFRLSVLLTDLSMSVFPDGSRGRSRDIPYVEGRQQTSPRGGGPAPLPV